MEEAKFKILPAEITKKMIEEYLREQGCTFVRYSGKNERFFYTDKNGKEQIYSKDYLTNILINKEKERNE